MKGVSLQVASIIIFIVLILAILTNAAYQINSNFRVYEIKTGEKSVSDSMNVYKSLTAAVSSSLYFSVVQGINDYALGRSADLHSSIKKWLRVTNMTMSELPRFYRYIGYDATVSIDPDSLEFDPDSGVASVRYNIRITGKGFEVYDENVLEMRSPEFRSLRAPYCPYEDSGIRSVRYYIDDSKEICLTYNKSVSVGYVEYWYGGNVNTEGKLLSNEPYIRKNREFSVLWKSENAPEDIVSEKNVFEYMGETYVCGSYSPYNGIVADSYDENPRVVMKLGNIACAHQGDPVIGEYRVCDISRITDEFCCRALGKKWRLWGCR